MAPSTRSVVVFDLGGVLAQICHTWEQAVEVAGVPNELSPNGRTPLAEFSGFDLYQSGRLSFDTYLRELGLFVGCSELDALRVHNSIIIGEYPGVPGFVAELKSVGYRTGCLSNTNAAHWEHLALNGLFPTIASLEMKMASHLIGLNKPDPEVFRTYCREFELQPSQILYFDDHDANVAAANDQGWSAHWIDSSSDPVAQMRASFT